MSTHPNTILMLVLTPDDLARKTYRAILSDAGITDEGEMTRDIKIGRSDYHHRVMERDYDEGFQISAKEGDIVLHDFLTYGYGERAPWDKVETQKKELEAWAKSACKKYACKYEIFLTANYW